MIVGTVGLRLRDILAIATVGCLLACSGGGGATSSIPAPAISVSLEANPNSGSVSAGDSVVFTVTVTGSSNTTVTWTVDGAFGGNATVGTIAGTGNIVIYRAPSATGSHTIKATSNADSTRSASYVITVIAAPVQVTLSPGATTVASGASVPFTASVTGSSNTAVTWTVDGITGGNVTIGTIAGTGSTVTYTAPTAAGTHTITATSVADTTKSASSVVTVLAPPPPVVQVSLSPGSATLTSGATVSLTATVTGSSNTAVTWTVDGITGGNASVGTLTGSGSTVIYTAPSTAGTHTVRATSNADPAQSASAIISVTVPSSIISVIVSPDSLSLNTGVQSQFTATVSGTGSFSSEVSWSAQRGSITGTGLYTAPSTAGSDLVTAASTQNPAKTGTAVVTVTTIAPTITSVVVSPVSWSLNVGEQKQFTATVTGTGNFNPGLTWSAQRGSINSNGLYTAPTSNGSDLVTAKSIADPTKSSSSTISVQSGCVPAPGSSQIVNVRDAGYDAKGDGVTDDTAAIQRAVNAVAGTGGTVLVPDGTYMINTVVQSGSGIRLGSNMTLRLSSAAVLKAIPNAAANYAILAISSKNHVNIVGGTLLGDRSTHLGTTGEWGMGLSINQSDHVVVDGITSKDCWGDGFYVGNLSSNVTLCNVTADHNRRQGLSVTSVDGMVVRNSTFKNTAGAVPETGVNLEPNSGETVNNVLITGCTLTNNAGGGFQCGTPFAGAAFGTNLVLDRSTVSANGVNPVGGGYRMAIHVTVFDGVQITNNQVLDNVGEAIRLTDNATHTMVKGNTVKGTLRVTGSEYWTGVGILLSTCAGSTVTENTVTGNAGPGIWQLITDPSVTIFNNTVSGNGTN